MNTKAILKRIRKARLDNKMTLEVASGLIGISISTLSEVERGEIPMTVERLLTLCHIYNANPIQIFTGVNPNFDALKARDAVVEAMTQLGIAANELK